MVERISLMSPTMRATKSLPSLNALRVFESAARHESFVQAAEELHVTPGAVSHQIATLESSLGTELFRRGTRSVVLTTAGRALLPKLSEGFASLREAVDAFDAAAADRTLHVSLAPAFASRWLMPRLPRFASAHPEISLSLSTGLGLIDLVHPDASSTLAAPPEPGTVPDLSIRFGHGEYAGMRSDRLLTPTVTPVCSPSLLRGEHPLRVPGDLAHHVLLHDDTAYFEGDRVDWAAWLTAAGLDPRLAQRGPRFSHSALALDAAEDGLGVALGLSALVETDVAAGRLVTPFALEIPSPFGYWLVSAESVADQPEVEAFRDWMLSQAAIIPELATA